MTFEKATAQDTGMLTELRIAYLQEDLGEIEAVDLELIESLLPGYYEKHLNRNLMVYVARNEKDIVSCAFLLIVEKPMSPSFITGKTGTVLNVYTKPEYRKKGYAKKLMNMMLDGNQKIRSQYMGEYLVDYSWSEGQTAFLDRFLHE